MSCETPHVGKVRDVHGDGGFAEIPELVAVVPDIAEREIFGSAGASYLARSWCVSSDYLGLAVLGGYWRQENLPQLSPLRR